MTAGNSSQTSDGAAAVLVTSAAFAKARGLTAAGALRRLRHRGRRARAVRHRPGAGDPQGAEARRPDARPDRSRRAERGVCRAGARLPARAADRSRQAQRQRRRDRARSSAGMHWRQAHGDAAARDAPPRSRATAWSRCASAAAWARPASSSGCRAGCAGRAATRYDTTAQTTARAVPGSSKRRTPPRSSRRSAVGRASADGADDGGVRRGGSHARDRRSSRPRTGSCRERWCAGGELGLLGLSAPEQYGGLDLDKASALVVSSASRARRRSPRRTARR